MPKRKWIVLVRAVLLLLLLLVLALPFSIREYGKHTELRWENIVQPHWEDPGQQTDDVDVLENRDDVVEENPVAPEPVELEAPAPQPVKTPAETTVALPAPSPASQLVTLPTKTTPQKMPDKKTVDKKPADQKKTQLKLHVPENLYKGHAARWEEKKPKKLMPDFFAPKPEESSSVQFGGQLITDDKVKQKNPDADFIDTIKGAEVNISVRTR